MPGGWAGPGAARELGCQSFQLRGLWASGIYRTRWSDPRSGLIRKCTVGAAFQKLCLPRAIAPGVARRPRVADPAEARWLDAPTLPCGGPRGWTGWASRSRWLCRVAERVSPPRARVCVSVWRRISLVLFPTPRGRRVPRFSRASDCIAIWGCRVSGWDLHGTGLVAPCPHPSHQKPPPGRVSGGFGDPPSAGLRTGRVSGRSVDRTWGPVPRGPCHGGV